VGVPGAAEQFGRALADPFGSAAPLEAVVVEEEPQQIQIPVADLPSQEEVVPKTAVEILRRKK
jgi:hypothetical protein